MSAKTKSVAIQIVKFAFAFALVYWMVSRGDLNFALLLKVLKPKYLIVGFLFILANIVLFHYRWYLLLKCRKIEVTFLRTLPLTLVGLFFNFAMPGAVGGDFAKIYYITKHHPEQKLDAGTTVLVDRILGLLMMMVLALIGILINFSLVYENLAVRTLFITLTALILGFGLAGLLFLSPFAGKIKLKNQPWANWKGVESIVKVLVTLRQYKSHKMVLFNCALVGAASQMMAVFFFVVVASALNEQIAFSGFLFSVCLGFIASALPISPGGVGVGQVAFNYFFNTYTGQNLQVGAIGITLDQVMLFCIGLTGLLYFLKSGELKPKDLERAYD